MFPAEVLPVVTVLTNLVQFLLGLPVLLAFLIAQGHLAPSALLVPLPMLVQLVLTVGLALLRLRPHRALPRHAEHPRRTSLHLWFFATPVLYYVRRHAGPACTPSCASTP